MRLSLAMAFFLAATISADAAPQAKAQRKTEAKTVAQMVTVSGECTKLVHAWHPVEGCKNMLVNMNYSTGTSAYWFLTEDTVLSFSGDGSRRVEQGSSIVVQAIEKVILAAMTSGSQKDDAKEEDAVGFCRFGDVTAKGTAVECMAHTQAGLFEGAFTTDGNPPEFIEFRINP